MAFQPMAYSGTAGPVQAGFGHSYFPWIYQFNSANNATDAIVPVWSQALGIPPYSPTFDVNHLNAIENSQVQQQVIRWLSDPNVPLGSAQRTAWLASGGNQPPVSQRNAYAAGVIGSSGASTGGGLNPNAVVGVQFAGSGYAPATWDSNPANVGIKVPTLTGMMPRGDIGSEHIQVVDELGTTLDDLHAPAVGQFVIDPGQYLNAQPSDWVAFSLTLGGVGRQQDQVLTGPNGSGEIESWAIGGIGYTMPDLPDLPGHYSALTTVNVPKFTVPILAHSGLTVYPSGAVESANSNAPSQTIEVDLYSQNIIRDTELAALSITVQHPGGVWDGVLLPYSTSYTLLTDSSGFVYGPLGDSGKTTPQVYQWLIDPSAGKYASIPVTVP